MIDIPFHLPDIDELEINACVSALSSGNIVGDGVHGRKVQDLLKSQFHSSHVLLTTSCTHSMELALLALGIGPGDDVILPSFTFSSTANAIVLQGAKPVFAEINEATLTISPRDIERRITPRTKAIMPVHYAGVSCQMDEIIDIAKRYKLIIVEDAAQGVGAKYRSSFLGTIGDVGCFSFHGTKIVTCGEGGAFLTNDEDLARKAEIIREKGTNRSAFFRGEVDKYSWMSRGSSYVLSDILASILEAQLTKLSDLISARKNIHDTYINGFKELSNEGYMTLPTIPGYAESNYHVFYILLNTEEIRDKVLKQLTKQGIGATFHYIPLHSSPFGQGLGYKPEDFPITEQVSKRLLRLPIYPRLTSSRIEQIIEAVSSILVNDRTNFSL